jgi:hypothetical protein
MRFEELPLSNRLGLYLMLPTDDAIRQKRYINLDPLTKVAIKRTRRKVEKRPFCRPEIKSTATQLLERWDGLKTYFIISESSVKTTSSYRPGYWSETF